MLKKNNKEKTKKVFNLRESVYGKDFVSFEKLSSNAKEKMLIS